MSDYNPYIKRALRVTDGEISWGQLDCPICDGRGWGFIHVVGDNYSEIVSISSCTCSPAHTSEDADRLAERLFLIAHFYRLESDDGFEPPEDECPETETLDN